MDRRWLELRFETAAEHAEIVYGLLSLSGLLASTVEEPPGRVAICAYLPDTDEGRRKCQEVGERVSAQVPESACATRSLAEESWASAWKEHWRPTRVGRVVVCPTWLDFAPGADDLLIRLDPEMAFGTGAHESTRLCLAALQKIVKLGDRVLDLGCGTGVLAIAAVMLGAAEAVAVDNDPIAAQTTRRNADRNGCGPSVLALVGDACRSVRGPYDVAVANIDVSIVGRLVAEVAPLIPPGGHYVAGGLIAPQEEQVRAAFEGAFAVEEALRENSWRCLIGRRL